jgi:hypothetical protein
LGFGNTGTVVVDLDDDAPLDRPDASGDAGDCVPGRVVEEVADDPGEVLGVPADLPGGHAGEVNPDLAPLAAGLRDDEIVQVDQFSCCDRRRRSMFATSDEEEVVDEALHAYVLVEDFACRLPPATIVRSGECDLEFVTDDGDGGAQFVGRVGHESGLAPMRVLETVEHAVHRGSESSDLVTWRGDGDALVELAGTDLVHAPSDRVDWTQRSADDDPGQPGEEDEQTRNPDNQRGDKGLLGALKDLQRRADGDRDALTTIGRPGMNPERILAQCGNSAGRPPRPNARQHRRLTVDVAARGDDSATEVQDLHEARILALHRDARRRSAAVKKAFDVHGSQLETLIDRAEL